MAATDTRASALTYKGTQDNAYVYEYNMPVGESAQFYLTDFAVDLDNGDDAKMKLTPVQGTSYFLYNAEQTDTSLNSPNSASNQRQFVTLSGRGDNYFTITAENFSATGDKNSSATTIKFYIADGSGAEGQVEIHLWINVVPSDIVAVKTGSSYQSYTVKSVIDYEEDENAAPTSINIVSRPTALTVNESVFKDNDLSAQGTRYTLKVYSMTETTGENSATLHTLAQMSSENPGFDKKKLLAFEAYLDSSDKSVTVVRSSENGKNAKPAYTVDPYVDKIWEYLDANGVKFDATTGILNLVPKKSTPKNESILLYVEISKPFVDLKNDTVQSYKNAYSQFAFTVANSKPKATPEIADNMNNDRTSYLTFEGYRGDTREYKVYVKGNTKDRKTLFEDSDSDDTITISSMALKREGNQAQVYKIVPNEDDDGTTTVYYPERTIADDDSGRGDAVTFEYVRATDSIRITINRRVTTDNYNNLPTYIVYTITGRDSADNIVTTDITVVVKNSEPGFKKPDNPDDPEKGDEVIVYDDNGEPLKNVTMTFDGIEYNMVIRLEPTAADTVLYLRSFYTDKDFAPGFVSSDKAVFLNGGLSTKRYYNTVGTGSPTPFKGTDKSDTEDLFSVNAMRDNEALIFRAISYNRGRYADTVLIISDDTGAPSVQINIRLIVDNTAPTRKNANSNDIDEIYIIGSDEQMTDFDDALEPIEFNLYDYVTDPNPNDLRESNENRVQIGTVDGTTDIVLSSLSRKVTYYGKAEDMQDKYGQEIEDNLVYVSPAIDKFTISPKAGYYGYQVITINVRDGSVSADDTKTFKFDIKITVTRNPNDVQVQDLRLAYNKLYEITPQMLFIDKETNEYQGDGFEIKAIRQTDNSSVIAITQQDPSSGNVKNASSSGSSKKWFIRALNRTGLTPVEVDIGIIGRDDVAVVTKPFNIQNVPNIEPHLQPRFEPRTPILFQSGEMDDKHVVTIPAASFVYDEENDEITLLSAKSKKSIVVSATIDTIDNMIRLTFNGRGSSLITVTLTDESLEPHTYTFIAYNDDLPQLNFFLQIGANVQANPLIYIIIAAGILLFIIILIIIIAAVKKKKRIREEIEALLVSEMELEEQMLKLAASPQPTYYQSYGYLPPTQGAQTNPQLMLGDGTGAPPQNQGLALNAGTGNNPDDDL